MIANTAINRTGYGIASLNILKALYEIDNNISFFPIGGPGVDNKNDYDFVNLIYRNSLTANFEEPCLKIWHQFDLASRIGKGKYYAYPFFELDTFNDLEKRHMSVPDHIFTSSKWAMEILSSNGINAPISVIPLGVDTKVFDYKKINQNKDEQKYIFANIGKWEVRKGHDFLSSVFSETFPDEQNVELWILASENTNSYSSKEDLIAWKKLYSKDSRIKLFSGFNGHEEIADFISKIDCGVFPSRAEGWNLELLECMAMNKPVICTDYSAHTEFCNKDNSYLIDIENLEKAYDGKAFNGQGSWAEIGNKQINQLKEYMRHCYENNIRNNQNGLITAQKLSWNNSANIVYGCMNS